ncbi:hypothetical protein HK096_006487 [Nowakowskiella sp. JEL0078]|nr:hypothetical protein HK096_006487 [Nowakowskiella sp. JEL0078]
MKLFKLFTLATIAFAVAVSSQDVPNLDDLIGGGGSQDIVTGSLDSATSANIDTSNTIASTDAATTNAATTDAATTDAAVTNVQVTNTDGGAILAPTTTTTDTYATPTPGLTPDENSDLECFDFVDDFAAFNCVEVDASSVNTKDFDCVDDLSEPNLQCFNVDGSEFDCENPTSGSSLLDDLVSGSTPSAEANADTSANGNVDTSSGNADNSAGNLVAAAGSRMYSPLFRFSNIFSDSTIIGVALAAGAAFVF